MDEQTKKTLHQLKTVWKWLLAAVRWLSVIIFTVLFVLGLYFKLPWKVLACLAVIPAVWFFAPKKIQSWIWIALAAILVAVFAWIHLPEHNAGHWRPYQFSNELTKIENGSSYSGPNAADLYEQVLNEYGETIFYFRFTDTAQEQQTQKRPWDPAEHPRLDFWISALDPAIQNLIKASRIDQCRFDVPYNMPSTNPQMGRLNQLKGWTRILLRASWRDVYNGQDANALIKQLTIIRMARHVYQQNTLLDQSAAFQIELLGARAIESYIIEHASTIEDFNDIQTTFASLEPRWPGSWPDILAREKLQSKNLMGLLYETDSENNIRFAHMAMTSLQEGLGYKPRRLFLNQHVMNRIGVIMLWLTMPSDPQKLANLIDERFNHYSLQVQKGNRIPQYSLKYIWVQGLNINSLIDWLATRQVGYFWALDGQFTRHLALMNRIAVFTALKQYYITNNKWPQRLDDLPLESSQIIDPLNSKPFNYKKKSKGFQLYSLGLNGIDDGGVYDEPQKKDDIMIWPKRAMQFKDAEF